MPKRRSRKRIYTPRSVYRRTRRIGGKMFGGIRQNLGLKALAVAAIGLPLMRRFQPFGGAYKPAVDMSALGIISNTMGAGNADLISAGIKYGIATAVDQYLLGGLLGGLGGGNAQTGGGL